MSRSAAVTARHVRRKLRNGRSGFGVASGKTFRFSGALGFVARLGLLERGANALDLLFRGGKGTSGRRERGLEFRLTLREPSASRRPRLPRGVPRTVRVPRQRRSAAVSNDSRVAVACATVCSRASRASPCSRDRCAWDSSSAADIALSCRDSALRSSEILRNGRSVFRVVSGATLRLGDPLRRVARLGLLQRGANALDLLFRAGQRSRGRRERGLEFRLAPPTVVGGGMGVGLASLPGFLEFRPRSIQLLGERVARSRGVGETGGEFSVTLGETIDGGSGVRCTLLLGLAQYRFELQQPFLERRADPGGACRCLMFSFAVDACPDKLLLRLPMRGLDGRQLRLEHLPPRALMIERSKQAGLLSRVHPSGIGRKPSEIQRAGERRSVQNLGRQRFEQQWHKQPSSESAAR